MTQVYLLSYDGRLSQEEYAFFYEYADEERRERAERFRVQADKERCLLAGTLLKCLLTHYRPERDIFIERDINGKPYMKGGPEFSLTHSGRWIGAAVSELPVGLDIEGGREFRDLAVSKFSDEERKWYENLPVEQKESGFYRLWTAKEAYGKRDGRGVGRDLSEFSVLSEEIAKDLFFRQIGEDYYLSVCTEEPWDGEICFFTIPDILHNFIKSRK